MSAKNDSIFADKANDLVYGGKAGDWIWGELGADTIVGDEGEDSLYGGLQNPLVFDVDGRDLFGGDDTKRQFYILLVTLKTSGTKKHGFLVFRGL